jgi:hypothetical protein
MVSTWAEEAEEKKDERQRNTNRNPLTKNNVPSVSFKTFHSRWHAGPPSSQKVENNRANFSYALDFKEMEKRSILRFSAFR